jgi:hypothetical protein
MKRRIHCIVMPFIGIMLSATAFSATYYSQGSVAPNTLSSWNTNRAGGGSTPSTFATVLTSDRFVVQNGHTMTTTATWNIGSLVGSVVQVESGGILVASNAINIASLAGSGFQLDNGGKYTHNNTSTISGTVFSANTVTISAGSIFQVNTNVTLPSRTYSYLIINNTTSVDAAGIITVDNTLTINASCIFDMKTFKLNNGASFSSSGTGTLRTQCTTATSTAPIPVGFTWAAGSTVQYNASAAQTVVGGTYSNLTISNTGGGNASADITVSLVLTVGSSEIFDLTTFRLINGGSFSHSGTGTIRTQCTTTTSTSPLPSSITWASGSLVQYNSTAAAQTVVGGSYSNLRIGNTSSANAAADITVSLALTVDASCFFNLTTFRLINGGSFSHSGTGTIRTQCTTTTSTSPLPSSITWASGSLVQYNSTAAAQTVVGGSYSNLRIGNTSSANAAADVTVSAILTVDASCIFDLTTFRLINGGSFSHSGTGTIRTQCTTATSTTPIPSGITWTSGSLVQYNSTAAAQTVVGGSYSNLRIGNTSSANAAANITVSLALTVDASCIFDLTTFRLINGGSFSHSGTGTIRTQCTTATSVLPIPSSITWAAGSTIQYNGSAAQTVVAGPYSNLRIGNTSSANAAANISVALVLTVDASCLFDLTTFQLLNGGSFSNSGTGTIKTQSTNALPIPSGITTWSGTVQYSSSSVQTVVSGTYNNLTISNTNSANASTDITVSSIVTVDASCFFNMQTNRLINGGSFSNSGTGTVRTQSTNATPIPAGITWSGTVIYNGTGAQTVVGGSYNNLTISSTGTKTLAADASAAGAFTLSASTDFLAINGNHLTLNGTTSLTGFIKGSTVSKLTVGGSSGGSATIKLNAAASDSLLQNLTLNRSGASAGLTLASNVGIIGLLTITSGDFNLNNKIVSLKSSSIASTAQLGTVGGTISYGTSGSFTLERFIPDGNRSYRDLSAGLSSTYTIFQNWQEKGVYPVVGNGIFITGVVGLDGVNAPSGLDQTQTGSKSMHTFVSGAWSDITNTYVTMSPYQGYRVLIRGDRNFLLSTVPQPTNMNNSTVLRINGSVITGTLNYANTGITNGGGSTVSTHALNNAVNGYTMIGNPYPAAIDWSLLSRTNMSGSYWYYDGTIGTDGAYVSWNGSSNSNPSSNVNKYIQPGQAFFVQTTVASPTMGITETAKATASTLTNVFRETSTAGGVNKLSFMLLKNVAGKGFINMDGATIVCSSETNADASKFTNTTENLSINKWGKQLSIQQRVNFVAKDSILLKLTKVVNGASYKISFDTRNLISSLRPILVDKYLNIQKAIKANDTTQYAFTVNTADTFSFSNRFKVVFQNNVNMNVALPLTDFSLTAKRNNASIDLSWRNGNEEQVKSYELEHAANGISFSKVFETTVASGNYSWKHKSPPAGKNNYRIKLVYQDGKTEYSSIVSAELALYNPSITFNGSSINTGNAAINIKGLAKGSYELKLVNTMGQILISKPFVYTEAMQYKLNKPTLTATGLYSIVITNNETGEKIAKEVFIGL